MISNIKHCIIYHQFLYNYMHMEKYTCTYDVCATTREGYIAFVCEVNIRTIFR